MPVRFGKMMVVVSAGHWLPGAQRWGRRVLSSCVCLHLWNEKPYTCIAYLKKKKRVSRDELIQKSALQFTVSC